MRTLFFYTVVFMLASCASSKIVLPVEFYSNSTEWKAKAKSISHQGQGSSFGDFKIMQAERISKSHAIKDKAQGIFYNGITLNYAKSVLVTAAYAGNDSGKIIIAYRDVVQTTDKTVLGNVLKMPEDNSIISSKIPDNILLYSYPDSAVWENSSKYALGFGGMLHCNFGDFSIQPVYELSKGNGKTRSAALIKGYTITKNDKLLAALQIEPSKTAWMNNSLDEKTKKIAGYFFLIILSFSG